MQYIKFFVLFLGLVLASCQIDGNDFDPQGTRELTLLGGSGHPDRLGRIDVPKGTVQWIPIEVGGYIKAIETVDDRVYVIVLDVSETDSAKNGLFQLDRGGGATRIALEGEPIDSSVMAISSWNGGLYAMTEYSIFEIRDRGTVVRRLGDAHPYLQAGSLSCAAGSLAYISSDQKLAVFDNETTETTFSTPKKFSRNGFFQGFIVGSLGDQLLLSKYRESYCWLGASHDPRSERILKLAKANKVEGLKEYEDVVLMWRNIEIPKPEVGILIGGVGEITTIGGINVTDLSLAPAGFMSRLLDGSQ